MFASLAKYTSPKQLLASYLCEALADFFKVDPSQVEANLLRDAKVCLNNVDFKEQRIGQLLVSGSVTFIEFAWEWDTQSLISNVTLTVQGGEISVKLIDQDEDNQCGDQGFQDNKEAQESKTDSTKSSLSTEQDWKARYLQQIIDHLTLIVTDLQIKIDLSETSKLVLEAKDISLGVVDLKTGSSQSPQNEALKQIISVAHVEAYIADNATTSVRTTTAAAVQRFPIIDPFGYSASVQRISGRRFLDGIMSGLLIQGENIHSSSGESSSIRLHVGLRQMQGLRQLQDVLLSIGTSAEQEAEFDTTQQNAQQQEIMPETGEDENLYIGQSFHSIFSLPIQSLEIILDNDASFRFDSCVLRYCTDGTELSVACDGGLWIDESELCGNSRWMIDIAKSAVLLDKPPSQKSEDVFYDAHNEMIEPPDTADQNETKKQSMASNNFHLRLSIDEIAKLYAGAKTILQPCTEILEVAEEVLYGNESLFSSTSTAGSSTSSTWSMKVNGTLHIHLAQKDKMSLNISMDSPYLAEGDSSLPFYLQCQAVDICSSSLLSHQTDDIAINIPGIDLVQIAHPKGVKRATMVIKDSIKAKIDSSESLQNLQKFYDEATEVFDFTSKSSVALPVDLSISSVEVIVLEPQHYSLVATGVSGSGDTWKIDRMVLNDFKDSSIEATALQMTLKKSADTILSGSLSKESKEDVESKSIEILNDHLAIHCETLRISQLENSELKQESNYETTISQTPEYATCMLSLPITVNVDTLLATKGQNQFVEAKRVCFGIIPEKKELNIKSEIRLNCDSLKLEKSEVATFHCIGVETIASFDCSLNSSDTSQMEKKSKAFPLDILCTARLKVKQISQAKVFEFGHLARSLSNVSLNLEEDKVLIQLDVVHFECPKVFKLFSQEPSADPLSLDEIFEIFDSFQFKFNRVIVMPEFVKGKPGVCFDSFDMTVTQSKKEYVSFNMDCKFFQGRGPDSSNWEVQKLGLCVDTPKNDISNLKRSNMNLQLHEISKLQIPGSFHLDKPLSNFSVKVNGGWLVLDCDSIQLSDLSGQPTGTAPSSIDALIEKLNKNLPLPLRCNCNSLTLRSQSQAYQISTEKAFLEMIPASNSAPFIIRTKVSSLTAVANDTKKMTINGLTFSSHFTVLQREETVLNESLAKLGIRSLKFVSIDVDSCSEIIIDDSLQLQKPIVGTKISYHDGMIWFNLNTVHVKGNLTSSQHTIDEHHCFELQNDICGIPIGVEVKHLYFNASMNDDSFILNLSDLKATSSPDTTKSTQMSCDVSCHDCILVQESGTKLCASRMFIHLTLENQLDYTTLFSGKLRFEEISELIIPNVGEILQPVSSVISTFENNEIKVELDNAVFAGTTNTESNEDDIKLSKQSEQGSFLVEYPLNFSIGRFVMMASREIGAQGFCMVAFQSHITPASQNACGSIKSSCNIVKAVGGSSMGIAAEGVTSDVRLDSFQTNNEGIFVLPGYGSVFGGTLKISSISELMIENLGKVTNEITGAQLSFSKGGIQVGIQNIEFSHVGDNTSPVVIAAEGESDFVLPKTPIEVTVGSLIIEKESICTMYSKNMTFHLKPDPFDLASEISISCIDFQGGCANAGHISARGLVASATFRKSSFLDQSSCIDASIPGVGRMSSAVVEIDEVSTLNISGMASLLNPIQKVHLRIDSDSIHMDCPCIQFLRETPQNDPNRHTLNSTSSFPPLPCNLKMKVLDICMAENLDQMNGNCTRLTKLHSMELTLMPVFARIGSDCEGPGAGVYCNLENFEMVEGSTILRAPSVSLSGIIQFDKLDRVGNFVVSMDAAELAADFSSINWSTSFEDKSLPLMLPFASIPKFDLNLKFAAAIVKIRDAKLHCEGFEGGSDTTYESLSRHYVEIVKRRLPYLFSKADIAGANIGDSFGMVAGTIATRSSVIGSTVGIAARDAVGAALTKGKSVRGATETEKYKFGDFSRGVVASVKSAATTGRQMRGSETYEVGDFSAGTARAVGDYTSKNKVRLAGAGGSALGMVAGAAIAGPIGLVAGSLLGSSTAQSSMRSIGGDSKQSDQRRQNSEPQTAQNQQRLPLNANAAPDLLSSSSAGYVYGGDGSTTAPIGNQSINRPTGDLIELTEVAEAQLLGEVATSNDRAVMVQAQVLDQRTTASNGQAFPMQEQNLLSSTRSTDGSRVSLTTSAEQQHHSDVSIQNPHYGQAILNMPSHETIRQSPIQSNNRMESNSAELINNHGFGSQIQQPAYRHNRNVPQMPPSNGNRTVSSTNGHSIQQDYATNQRTHISAQRAQQSANNQGYRFGDITRGIASRGRQLDGRNQNSGYKFGDFTRGLFG